MKAPKISIYIFMGLGLRGKIVIEVTNGGLYGKTTFVRLKQIQLIVVKKSVVIIASHVAPNSTNTYRHIDFFCT